jgi:hypothetical protein
MAHIPLGSTSKWSESARRGRSRLSTRGVARPTSAAQRTVAKCPDSFETAPSAPSHQGPQDIQLRYDAVDSPGNIGTEHSCTPRASRVALLCEVARTPLDEWRQMDTPVPDPSPNELVNYARRDDSETISPHFSARCLPSPTCIERCEGMQIGPCVCPTGQGGSLKGVSSWQGRIIDVHFRCRGT